MTVTLAALPGLLGFLTEDQRALLTALAGMDQGAPRTLAEATQALGRDAETLFYEQALINRALLSGIIHPDPGALRLLASLVTEFPVQEEAGRRGVYSLLSIAPALRASGFPARFRFLNLVCLWTGGAPGSEYPAGLRIKTPDNATLLQMELPLRAPGAGAIHVQEYRVAPCDFPAPGLYSLEVWLIGAPLYAQFLPVFEETRDAQE